ncbi:MAG: hydrogenase maturation protease [Synergistaceae bacterium]|nr:hydrogenase maturation protease [Synergistaceae bacterium]
MENMGKKVEQHKREQEKQELQIWGLGNPLLGDDAVGCAVAERLTARGVPGVLDCGTTPENYLAPLRRKPPSALLIVDAADMGLPPGEFRLLTLEEMSAAADSSHGIPPALLLEPFRASMEIVIIGIQPESCRIGSALSAAVERAARLVTEKIAEGRWREIEKLTPEEL